MEISEKQLREKVEELTEKLGKEGTIEYIAGGNYSQELKDKAMAMLQPTKTEEELPMAEGGDISDMGL